MSPHLHTVLTLMVKTQIGPHQVKDTHTYSVHHWNADLMGHRKSPDLSLHIWPETTFLIHTAKNNRGHSSGCARQAVTNKNCRAKSTTNSCCNLSCRDQGVWRSASVTVSEKQSTVRSVNMRGQGAPCVYSGECVWRGMCVHVGTHQCFCAVHLGGVCVTNCKYIVSAVSCFTLPHS